IATCVAGCGSSGSSPPPSATPAATTIPVFRDAGSGITIAVKRVLAGRDHALLLLRMRNARPRRYETESSVPFRDTSYVEPTSGSSAGVCDSDQSHGFGLDYSSIPAHATHTGWI